MIQLVHRASISIVLLLSAVTIAAQSSAATGQIRGIVQAPGGGAVPNAIVSLSVGPQGGGYSGANVKTAANGSFSLPSLAPGSYEICVQAPSRDLLNPCKWTQSAAIVQAGKTTDVGVIQLVSGTLLRVHVADAAKILAAAQSRTPGTHLLVGVVTSNGLFTPMPIQSADATGRDYEIYVPQDQSMQLSVFSNLLELTDQNGAAVNVRKGATVPIQAQAGSAPRIFTFQITGINNAGKP